MFKLKNKLYVGRVAKGYNVPEELESWKTDSNDKLEYWYIESLDGTHKYYPYASGLIMKDKMFVNYLKKLLKFKIFV